MLRLTKAVTLIGLFRQLDSDIPSQQIHLFLLVAMKEGQTAQELADRLGIAMSSFSRNLSALRRQHRLAKPGLDLVEARRDPEEHRRFVHYLTPKGLSLAHQLCDILEEKT